MPTDSTCIRPARPDEAALLSDIAMRSKAHWGYEQKYLDAWRDDLTITSPQCDGVSLWVIESHGAVVGLGEILEEPEAMILDDLWIDPAHIGNGYGRMLFTFLKNLAVERGATRIRLDAEPAAVGFYERMGARVIGERVSQTVPGRTLPVMELDLTTRENTTIYRE